MVRFFWLVLIAVAAISVLGFAEPDQIAQEKAGAALFRDKGCAFCHGVGGVGTGKAPALLNLRDQKEWTAEKITNQILNGGQKMPPFADSVTDEEAAQLVAYLRAKNKPEPPAATPAQ